MTLHDEIVQAFNNYLAEAETFEQKNVKAAAARARKALGRPWLFALFGLYFMC